ncbi:MAG TPA: MGMT family protein [Anaerolineales bacterium]|nr:MGMT family protein [Anaerolineales bacterium]
MDNDFPPSVRTLLYDFVKKVPAGKVTTYGALARSLQQLGFAITPRWVGQMMAECPNDVPWQRVVNRQGECSNFSAAPLQRALLVAEGVEFSEDARIDLHRYLWNFEQPSLF